MSSQRFVPVAPMRTWFWLVLFACFSLVISHKCHECNDEKACEKGAKERDCPPPLVDTIKDACYTKTEDGKIILKGCDYVPANKTDDYCVGPPSHKICHCLKNLCNGSAGTKPNSSWSLFWIGLGLACSYTATLH